MTFVIGFFAGTLVGALALALWAIRLGRKEQAKEQQRAEEEALAKAEAEATLKEAFNKLLAAADQRAATIPNPVSKVEASVSDRLRKAAEITTRQAQLDVRRSDENKLHYNNLELEKLYILKTILKDGYDPLIKVRFDSGDQEMVLSSYIATIQRNLN